MNSSRAASWAIVSSLIWAARYASAQDSTSAGVSSSTQTSDFDTASFANLFSTETGAYSADSSLDAARSSLMASLSSAISKSEQTSLTTHSVLTATAVATLSANGGPISTITITYQSTLASVSVSASPNNSSTSHGTATVSTVAATSSGSTPSSAALGTGAKAGIGVGVALGIVVAILSGILLLRAHQRRKASHLADQQTEYGTSANKAELHHTDLPRTHGRSELYEKRALVELDAKEQSKTIELDVGDAPIPELTTKPTSNEIQAP